MTTRPSVSRRIASAVFGVERPGRGSQDVNARRDLPYGKRLLAAVLGVRLETRQGAALPDAGCEPPAVMRARTMRPPRSQPSSQNEEPKRLTLQVTPSPEGEVAPEPPAQGEEAWHNAGPGALRPLPPLTPRRRAHAAAGVRSMQKHLLQEDRQNYERLLDEALHSPSHRRELAAVGRRLSTEQLRSMALNATDLIASAAATEYQHYVAVREAMRDTPAHPGESEAPQASEARRTVRGAGAGAAAVVVVLTPVLAGTVAAMFLGVGYLMELAGHASSFSDGLLTTGWIFGAITAVAILVAATGLLLSVLRNGSQTETETDSKSRAEVRQAREDWRAALLQRGILPFLQEAQSASGAASAPQRASTPGGRIPQLGYSQPGSTSTADESEPHARPSYTSPDFTTPDFGGPELDPE